MFKKLRNNFLIFNMVITLMLVFVAFAAIYLISLNSMKEENEQQVMSLVENRTDVNTSVGGKNTIWGAIQSRLFDEPETSDEASVLTFNFSVDIDSSGDVKDVNSIYSISNATAQEITDLALAEGEDIGVVRYGDMFLEFAIVSNDQSVVNSEQVYFLDVTESYSSMANLLVTLIIVGIIMVVAIFFISKMFANRAIKPISDNWDRQKQFVADASHELKTPLAIINANYDALMANEDETIKSQERWLNHIKVGSDRMAHLVNDMLLLTKMEEGAISVNKSEFVASNSVYQVAASMEVIAREKNVAIRINIEPNVLLNTDEEKYSQLVTILLDNAVKYAEVGGWVDVIFTKDKKGTILSVSNSGPGIPAVDLPNVFNRFYRADKSRGHKTRGHGLGLAIAKSITEALGGNIEVNSVENQNTTFTLTL